MPYRSLKQQRAMWIRRKRDEAFHARFKKHAHEYAPGIPSKERIVPIKEHEGSGHLTIHEHHAHRAGKHFDVRVALGDQNAHSWATRRLPEPGQSVLAKQQPTHTRQYMDWQGRIEKGYGAGDVKIHRKGDVDVVESGPNKIVFNQFEGKKAHEYVLVRPKSDKPKDWLLMNRTTRHGQYQFPQFKESYGQEKIRPELAGKSGFIQPKVDGAHGVVVLDPGKRPRVFSYRVSKKGDVLEYTHKIPGLFANRVPTGFGRKVLRAEIYLADKKGRPLPAERTAGVLNSGIERARTLQRNTGGLRIMPFQIIDDKRPYAEKLHTIEQMAKKMPYLTPPETASTPEQKIRMIEQIRKGRHPMTREGVVQWSPEGRPTKAKITNDVDVHVRSVFEGTGKYRNSAGGFRYSYTPAGPIVGKVGSGLSDRQRADLWKHRHDTSGRVATVVYEKHTGKGTLFAPRFTRWHPDKDEPPTK